MAKVIPFPKPAETGHSYKNTLQTAGGDWTQQEKKLLDRAEFYQSMIVVLDDVRMQNARSHDYGMMEVITEEMPHYQQRLNEVQVELSELRRRYIRTHALNN